MKLNFKKIPEIIAKRIFFAAFIVFLMAMFTGFLFFLRYNLKIEEKIPENVFFFNQRTYNNIILLREKEEEKFLEIRNKEYPDLFEGKIKTNNKETLEENNDIKEESKEDIIREDVEEIEREIEEEEIEEIEGEIIF